MAKSVLDEGLWGKKWMRIAENISVSYSHTHQYEVFDVQSRMHLPAAKLLSLSGSSRKSTRIPRDVPVIEPGRDHSVLDRE